jgi:energy-coupling factor transporter ATP-binding protein EcfA2
MVSPDAAMSEQNPQPVAAASPPPPAVQIDRLRFAYPPPTPDSQAAWVIDGLSLEVDVGEWLAIMGANDTGKTTLCRLIAGLAPHLTGGNKEGRVALFGRDVETTPPPALASTVGLLFQEPEAQLFSATVEAEVAWGLENLGVPVPQIRQRIDTALPIFGLEALRNRSPDSLSGGEKKRVALAAVVAMRPKLLVLDEPMGGLDPLGRTQVLAALSNLRSDESTTIIMVESDPEAVAAFADRLVVLHQGRNSLSGTPREVFRRYDKITRLGVLSPNMAQLAASLNRSLGTEWDFLTVEEAQSILAVDLG